GHDSHSHNQRENLSRRGHRSDQYLQLADETALPGLDKAKIRAGEATQIRKYTRYIRAIHAKPCRQSREILIARSRWNPSAGVRIVGTINSKRRESTIGLIAIDGAAHDHVMASPAMVAALAVAREGAAEIAGGEGRDALREAGVAM